MNFRTLTDEQIVKLAYDNILMKWSKEWERKENARREGREAPIAEHWLKIYEEQMNELHAYMIG